MKVYNLCKKEWKISSRGFYFYVEIAMAAILLFVLLFVVPDKFSKQGEEYLHLDMPEAYMDVMVGRFEDADGMPEEVELKAKNETIIADLYENDEAKIYLMRSEEELAKLAEAKHKIGVSISISDKGEAVYTYYTQGNETPKLKNLLKVLGNMDDPLLEVAFEGQTVEKISTDYVVLSDRENLLPVFLTFNGSLMGLFIMAAYIFLDKKEGVIKAYAITPSPVWKYIMSKVLVLTVTSIVTSMIMILPIMGLEINYLLLILFLVPTGFFASALGLLLASYFDDMVKSFGVMYLLVIAMMLPSLSYFISSWDPLWLKFIPSYYIVYGFKEIFIKGDTGFILLIALGYLVVSSLLFAWANKRYKKTLSV